MTVIIYRQAQTGADNESFRINRLVTGANRGLGLAFAKVLLEMGAAKVYAAARNPEAVTLKGVVPLKLDVTSDEDAASAGVVDEQVDVLGSARRTIGEKAAGPCNFELLPRGLELTATVLAENSAMLDVADGLASTRRDSPRPKCRSCAACRSRYE